MNTARSFCAERSGVAESRSRYGFDHAAQFADGAVQQNSNSGKG